MDEAKQNDAPMPGATLPPSAREDEAIRRYDSASDDRISSIDEKRSSESTSSESAHGLLHEARELEAQTQPSTTSLEDSVPRRTKIIFVAIYFLLNLSLTLSNKSVLSRVSASSWSISSFAIDYASWRRVSPYPCIVANAISVKLALAAHHCTYSSHVDRQFRVDGHWALSSHAIEPPLASDASRLLLTVHAQHCNLQCLPSHGLRTIPSSDALDLPSRDGHHIPCSFCALLQ